MNHPIREGIGFGLTSGIITTLGLMVGLTSSTHSMKVVLSGILIIAIADALSDSFGMHISVESRTNKKKHIWISSISTFISKLIIGLSFIIPVILFPLNQAVIISIIWGLLLISLFSVYIAKKQREKCSHTIAEHLIIAIVVIVLTHYIGIWLSAG